MPICNDTPAPIRLWQHGKVIHVLSGIEPLLASWEKKSHPAQVRLNAYLDDIEQAIGLSVQNSGDPLFLHMDIDVVSDERLSRHYDLENYLTPVVAKLGHEKFCHVSARKYVGGGSKIVVGQAKRQNGLIEQRDWSYFACHAGAGTSGRAWKAAIREKLRGSSPNVVPSEAFVEVQIAWRCASRRNWVWLWKPTGDAMGPVLGEPDPDDPFNPNDDRIVVLGLHLDSNDSMGHGVDVALWWRPRETEPLYP